MAAIKAFRGIRPPKDLAGRIAALPYDVYDAAEARKETEREPYSFLCVDRAETQFPEGTDAYSPCVYQKAAELLGEMVQKSRLVQDEAPCYYLYELTMDGHSQTGIVACASIDDYLNGIIKKHENTRLEKEMDRIRHVDICNAQTGPIFLAYRKQEVLWQFIQGQKCRDTIFDFTAPDGIRHRGWKIEEEADVSLIARTFEKTDQIYIADGHHRAASAVKVGLKRRKEHPDYTGKEEFNYFLCVLFPDEELTILDYNRIVRDLNGLSREAFLEQLGEVCRIKESRTPVRPDRKGKLGMYLEGNWYELEIKETFCSSSPVEGLDVAILQKQVLAPILGIQDPKTDDRIDFVGGIRGLSQLERRVDEEGGVAFAMYPTSIGELFEVADAGLLMPPKSTWFEPKLRSGLFIHELK